MRPRLVLLIAAALIAGFAGAFGAFYLSGMTMKPVISQVTGKARVGGPFTLTDHTGKRVTEKDFAGKYKLIFFGFTHCPDVCPTELQVMSEALKQLGGKAAQVTPIFITVDPERDGVKEMADYVSNFHDRLVGLTGSTEEIRAVAKAYHVYYAKAKAGEDGDYGVDHTSIVYFMAPNGDYRAHFSFGTKPEAMAKGMAKFL
jgi:protein SCO1/2